MRLRLRAGNLQLNPSSTTPRTSKTTTTDILKASLLSNYHDRKAFDCGVEKLNRFLKHFAVKHSSINTSKTYVVTDESKPSIIKGFYTVSIGSIAFESVPENLPKHPIPVFHLARLAVDSRYQGQKIGSFLLIDALLRATQASQHIGIHSIDVIAKDEQSKSFYKKYGFTELSDNKMHLYLSIKTVKKLYAHTI